jgi:hypothetical protein
LDSIHQTHDLQPYHCTYEDCSDPSRLYGAKQEWIDHENQHRRVWHCHSHEAEFETQPEYLQHLKEQHPQDEPEDYTPEMIAAAVGASAKPHRSCPFCPTMFSDVTAMQKHVRYHLERLALYALPDMEEAINDELASERPSDSHQVIENRGRQDSIRNDFVEERQTFLASFAEDDFGRDEPTHGSAPLTKTNLELTQPSSPGSWLDTCLASQQRDLAPLYTLPSVAASLGPDGLNEPDEPILTSAAPQNDWSEAVNAVLEMKAGLNSQDQHRGTALSDGAESSHELYTNFPVDPVAFLNQPDDKQETPLLLASRLGHRKVVELLLNTGLVNVESRDDTGQTPLSLAAERGYEAVVRLLLEKGAEIESKGDYREQTPLSLAAKGGYEAVVRLLLEKGAEIESKDSFGKTPLSWAAEGGYEAVVRLLQL